MTISRNAVLPVAGLIVALLAGREALADAIVVGGAVTTPLTVNDASLGGSTATADGNTYTGSSVYSLISGAGFKSPTQINGNPNGNLLDYLVITSTSGQSVVLSEGEIDPGFGGSTNVDIIANKENGGVIAPELIIPGAANTVRDIVNIASITVFEASPGPAPITGQVSTQLSVSGNVTSPTSYSSLTGLPQTTQTDSFQAKGGTTTTTFTGVDIFTLLKDAGLSMDPAAILDDYLVATGSDGYAVVYSLGELESAFDTNSPAAEQLVAAVSGSTGNFRSTAPGDVKGGRYVSNLENLNVVDAVPEPNSLALLASPLLLFALGCYRRKMRSSF